MKISKQTTCVILNNIRNDLKKYSFYFFFIHLIYIIDLFTFNKIERRNNSSE